MASIKVTNLEGESRQIKINSDMTLMELLRDEGYEEILAMCGGSCSCATCHVYIDASNSVELSVIEEDEQMLLEMADNYSAEKSRLSCQIELSDDHDGLEVNLVELD